MSEEMLKNLIESYDPYKVTAEEIDGLTEMLKHESFGQLHAIIIKKIKEIEAVVKTRKKSAKKTHTPKETATRIRKKKTSTLMTDETCDELNRKGIKPEDMENVELTEHDIIPVMWFTYLIDKTLSQDRKDKNKKPKDP